MVLYMIGLGLGDERDITIKGYDAIKTCKYIYLEQYTAILGIEKEKLVNNNILSIYHINAFSYQFLYLRNLLLHSFHYYIYHDHLGNFLW